VIFWLGIDLPSTYNFQLLSVRTDIVKEINICQLPLMKSESCGGLIRQKRFNYLIKVILYVYVLPYVFEADPILCKTRKYGCYVRSIGEHVTVNPLTSLYPLHKRINDKLT
jgi:hypothetical protein